MIGVLLMPSIFDNQKIYIHNDWQRERERAGEKESQFFFESCLKATISFYATELTKLPGSSRLSSFSRWWGRSFRCYIFFIIGASHLNAPKLLCANLFLMNFLPNKKHIFKHGIKLLCWAMLCTVHAIRPVCNSCVFFSTAVHLQLFRR